MRYRDASMHSRTGEHAIVIGAGIAGLAAAHVLADHFDKVTLFERDPGPIAGARGGVPQGRHPHLLLAGGLEALGQLMPGIDRDLEAAGAIPIRLGWDVLAEFPGIGALPRRAFDIASFAMTRPLIERVMTRRVAMRDNIALLRGVRATSILTTPDGASMIGVRHLRDGQDGGIMPADLVVDASGRGSPTLGCLEALRIELVRQSEIRMEIGYATGILSLPAAKAPDFVALATMAEPPHNSRSGYVVRIGPERWQVMLTGRDDQRPPGEPDAFLAFAEQLASPTIADVLRRGTLEPDIARFAFHGNLWRHFGEPGQEMPAGLIPIGDAICRFNPVHGQGMTIALRQAGLLRQVLVEHGTGDAPAVPYAQDFLGRVESLIEPIWTTSSIPDFAYPGTRGRRPDDLDAQLQRRSALPRAAMEDADVHRRLLERQHLLDPEGSCAFAPPIARAMPAGGRSRPALRAMEKETVEDGS